MSVYILFSALTNRSDQLCRTSKPQHIVMSRSSRFTAFFERIKLSTSSIEEDFAVRRYRQAATRKRLAKVVQSRLDLLLLFGRYGGQADCHVVYGLWEIFSGLGRIEFVSDVAKMNADGTRWAIRPATYKYHL
jgi:hypothetical protein